jgi:C-terminal processing protease CtpA/Prc
VDTRKALKGVGGGLVWIILIALNLVFIYWIGTFHYLGSGFPYTFDFLLLPFLSGYFGPAWTRRHPWGKTLPLVMGILIYAALVGALSGRQRLWGWLLDLGPLLVAWSSAYILILSFGGWLRARPGVHRKWVVWAVSSFLLLAAFVQFNLPGYAQYYYLKEGVMSFFPRNLQRQSYERALETISSYLEEKYPYFEYKKVDWPRVKQEAKESVETANNDEEFSVVVKKMLDVLHDGHVFLAPAPGSRETAFAYVGAVGTEVEGKSIVLEIEANSPAAQAGVKPGIEILAVNGKPWKRDRFSIYGPCGGRVLLSYTGIDGKAKNVDIAIPQAPWKRPAPPVVGRALAEGFGYIQISRMAMDVFSFVPAFDRTLEKLWQTSGLIIDIRFNTGGAIVLTDQILGRLTGRKLYYGGMLNREGQYAPFYVVPRRPIYRGPVILLINEWNGSAADFFAYAAGQLEGVTLVGRPTSGVVSNPSKVLKLPGGARVQLVASGLADTSRHFVVEDVGVQPDIHVPYSLPDIRAGRDRDLETAVRILQEKRPGRQ